MWETLAANQPGRLGDPAVSKSSITDWTWVSFAVTTKEPTFFEPMEQRSGGEAGRRGVIAFKDSNWLRTTRRR
ncbi:oleate hydratase [Streptomyces sp. NPDC050549]|uniref:oleate hydratase n=1 Tax=Streptomyces sp. NPDC050549 TaxID=3155406 RepID=UPI0034194ACD